MKLLPHWVLTDKFPAFYDSESKTAIEQTARLYGAMQELITEYNSFVDSVNTHITDFMNAAKKDYEVFTTEIRQEFQDFIDVVELKLMSQDKDIQDAISYMKTNLVESARIIINEAIENGDLYISVKDEKARIRNFRYNIFASHRANSDAKAIKTVTTTDNIHIFYALESSSIVYVYSKAGQFIDSYTLDYVVKDASVCNDTIFVLSDSLVSYTENYQMLDTILSDVEYNSVFHIDSDIFVCDDSHIYKYTNNAFSVVYEGSFASVTYLNDFILCLDSNNNIQVLTKFFELYNSVHCIDTEYSEIRITPLDSDLLVSIAHGNSVIYLRGTIFTDGNSFPYPISEKCFFTNAAIDTVYVNSDYSGLLYEHNNPQKPLCSFCLVSEIPVNNQLRRIYIHQEETLDNIIVRNCKCELEIIGWDGSNADSILQTNINGIFLRDCGSVYLKNLTSIGTTNQDANTACISSLSVKYLHMKNCRVNNPDAQVGLRILGSIEASLDTLTVESTFKKYTFEVKEGACLTTYMLTLPENPTVSQIYTPMELASTDFALIKNCNGYNQLVKGFTILESESDYSVTDIKVNGTFNTYNKQATDFPELAELESGCALVVKAATSNNFAYELFTNRGRFFMGSKIGSTPLTWIELT